MPTSTDRLLRARWFAAGALAATALLVQFGASAQRSEPSPAAQRDSQPRRERAIEPIPDDGKLRIICFGAHPDDCELRAAGTAARWAAAGHHVKFVSVTNQGHRQVGVDWTA